MKQRVWSSEYNQWVEVNVVTKEEKEERLRKLRHYNFSKGKKFALWTRIKKLIAKYGGHGK
jgi:hypothetical protein